MAKTRIFFAIYAIANAGLIIYGLLALITPSILMESFSAHVYLFPENTIKVANYLSALFRLLGFLNLILGILGSLLLWQYRIKRQAWIAYTAIAITNLSYLGPIIFDTAEGSISQSN